MTPAAFRRPTFWVMAALVLVAAALRFRALDFGLPHTEARPDERAVINPALALLSGRLPQFYDYPWLYIWLVTIGYLGYFVWGALTGVFHSVADLVASWPRHWEPFFLISRAISAGFGTASVVAIYALGERVRDAATGVMAALFLTVAFLHVRDSHFGTTDIAMTFLIVVGLVLILDAHRTTSRRTFAAAGAVSGLAAATKYNALILVVPMVASYGLSLLDSPRAGRRNWVNLNVVWFALPFAIAFAVGVPFVALDTERFVVAMGELGHSMATGDPRIALSNGWMHHLNLSLRYGLGVPLLAAGLAGALVLAWSQPRLAVLVLSFPLVYFLVAGSIRNLYFRYAMPMVPFLCVAAAYLLARASDALAARWGPRHARLTQTLTVAAAVAIALPSAVSTWEFNRIMAQTDNRVVVADWFAANVPPGHSVLQSGGQYGLVQFAPPVQYKVWRWDGGRGAFMLDRARATGRPDWILVQDSPLPSATQPVVLEFLKEGYTFVTDFKALTMSDELVYDQQDSFYVPFSGFSHVERPGPNFSLYKSSSTTRRDADTPDR